MSNQTVTITVVTPSFNQAAFIEDTIQSVLSQAGDFKIDYIIRDGGSRDASVDIIKKYDELLKNGAYPVACKGISYRWVSEKDNGQADAINKGFHAAAGAIVAWINSDDCYTPGALSCVIDFFQSHPTVDIVYGDCNYVDSAGNVLFTKKSVPFVLRYLLRGLGIQQPSVFFRTGVVREVGALDTTLHFVFDNEYWIRMVRAGCCSAYVARVFSHYRFHDQAKTFDSSILFTELITVVRRFGSDSDVAAAYAKACFDYAQARKIGPVDAHGTLIGTARRVMPHLTGRELSALSRGMREAVYQHADGWYARGDMHEVRKCILTAVQRYPACMFHLPLVILFAKSLFGRRGISILKKIRHG